MVPDLEAAAAGGVQLGTGEPAGFGHRRPSPGVQLSNVVPPPGQQHRVSPDGHIRRPRLHGGVDDLGAGGRGAHSPVAGIPVHGMRDRARAERQKCLGLGSVALADVLGQHLDHPLVAAQHGLEGPAGSHRAELAPVPDRPPRRNPKLATARWLWRLDAAAAALPAESDRTGAFATVAYSPTVRAQ